MAGLMLSIEVNDRGTPKVQAFQQVIAKTAGVANSATSAVSRMGSAASQAGTKFASFTVNVESAVGSLKRLAFQLGAAYEIGTMVKGLIMMGDAYYRLSARVGLYTDSVINQQATMDKLYQVSQSTRVEMDTSANMYTKLAQVASGVGVNMKEIIPFIERVNKLVALSGSSSREASQGLYQFAQGLQSNRYGGDEFRSIAEGAAMVNVYLAKGMGLGNDIGKLKELSQSKKPEDYLTARKIVTAILKEADEIDAKFAQLPATIGQAMDQAKNALENMMGGLNKQAGFIGGIVQLFQDFTKWIDTNKNSINAWASIISSSMGGAVSAIENLAKAIGLLTVGMGELFLMRTVNAGYGRIQKVFDNYKAQTKKLNDDVKQKQAEYAEFKSARIGAGQTYMTAKANIGANADAEIRAQAYRDAGRARIAAIKEEMKALDEEQQKIMETNKIFASRDLMGAYDQGSLAKKDKLREELARISASREGVLSQVGVFAQKYDAGNSEQEQLRNSLIMQREKLDLVREELQVKRSQATSEAVASANGANGSVNNEAYISANNRAKEAVAQLEAVERERLAIETKLVEVGAGAYYNEETAALRKKLLVEKEELDVKTANLEKTLALSNAEVAATGERLTKKQSVAHVAGFDNGLAAAQGDYSSALDRQQRAVAELTLTQEKSLDVERRIKELNDTDTGINLQKRNELLAQLLALDGQRLRVEQEIAAIENADSTKDYAERSAAEGALAQNITKRMALTSELGQIEQRVAATAKNSTAERRTSMAQLQQAHTSYLAISKEVQAKLLALEAAMGRVTFAARIQAGAVTLLKGAWAFIGGLPGVLFLVGTAMVGWLMHMRAAKKEQDNLTQSVEDFVNQLKEAQKAQSEVIRGRIYEAKSEYHRYRNEMEQLQTQLEESKGHTPTWGYGITPGPVQGPPSGADPGILAQIDKAKGNMAKYQGIIDELNGFYTKAKTEEDKATAATKENGKSKDDFAKKLEKALEAYKDYIDSAKTEIQVLQLTVAGREREIPLLEAKARLLKQMDGFPIGPQQEQEIAALMAQTQQLQDEVALRQQLKDLARDTASERNKLSDDQRQVEFLKQKADLEEQIHRTLAAGEQQRLRSAVGELVSAKELNEAKEKRLKLEEELREKEEKAKQTFGESMSQYDGEIADLERKVRGERDLYDLQSKRAELEKQMGRSLSSNEMANLTVKVQRTGQLTDLYKTQQTVIDSIVSASGNVFDNMLDGGSNFKVMLADILKEVEKLIIKLTLMKWLESYVTDAVTGATSSGSFSWSGLISGLVGSAAGGAVGSATSSTAPAIDSGVGSSGTSFDITEGYSVSRAGLARSSAKATTSAEKTTSDKDSAGSDQGITIINVLTEEGAAALVATNTAKRYIINNVLENINNRGVLRKAISSVK